MTAPMLLLDQPEEELCDEKGWVEATTSEDIARNLLTPFVFDENGRTARPIGAAKRVWLRVIEPKPYPEDERWLSCEATDEGAREFYEFDVQDCETLESASNS